MVRSGGLAQDREGGALAIGDVAGNNTAFSNGGFRESRHHLAREHLEKQRVLCASIVYLTSKIGGSISH